MSEPTCDCNGCAGRPVCDGDLTCPGCISGEHGRDRRHAHLRKLRADRAPRTDDVPPGYVWVTCGCDPAYDDCARCGNERGWLRRTKRVP